ncbi:hypothetical protein SAMN05192533_109172 [Mesobacillus persicus]|uniref:YppG-like protein n=1 Tax=Mesobacillus persicus TaxID=930146 RepID=A0A1H8E5X0_9BACI|nr:hypothetical protein [Mesobacillus persicus]SEN14892.1 hypothetical protein SAMN05192533_109172 [Mesobacillus persicus]
MGFDYQEEESNDSITTNTEEKHSFGNRKEEHPFDRMMFGPSRSKHSHPTEPEPRTEDKKDILNQINLEEIMGHVDALMGSAKELKPMFNKIRPLIDQFLKK